MCMSGRMVTPFGHVGSLEVNVRYDYSATHLSSLSPSSLPPSLPLSLPSSPLPPSDSLHHSSPTPGSLTEAYLNGSSDCFSEPWDLLHPWCFGYGCHTLFLLGFWASELTSSCSLSKCFIYRTSPLDQNQTCILKLSSFTLRKYMEGGCFLFVYRKHLCILMAVASPPGGRILQLICMQVRFVCTMLSTPGTSLLHRSLHLISFPTTLLTLCSTKIACMSSLQWEKYMNIPPMLDF
jgi:hypothetical protein